MAILIDKPLWPAHGTFWSHVVSDKSLKELHDFVKAVGLPRRSFDLDHYDAPEHRYDELVAAGAVPVSNRELVKRLRSSGLRVTQRERQNATRRASP